MILVGASKVWFAYKYCIFSPDSLPTIYGQRRVPLIGWVHQYLAFELYKIMIYIEERLSTTKTPTFIISNPVYYLSSWDMYQVGYLIKSIVFFLSGLSEFHNFWWWKGLSLSAPWRNDKKCLFYSNNAVYKAVHLPLFNRFSALVLINYTLKICLVIVTEHKCNKYK